MIFCMIIHLFSFYYSVAFTIIYEKSAASVIESSLVSLVLAWFLVEIGTQIIQSGLRSLAMRHPNLE